MRTPRRNDSQEAVYENLRQLLAQRENLRLAAKRGRGPGRGLQARITRCGERVVELIDRTHAVLVVACLSFALAGLTLLLLLASPWNGVIGRSFETRASTASGRTDSKLAKTESVTRPSAESISLITKDAPPAITETFIIRVGSFRNLYNAERVAESLRDQTAGVRIDMLAGGLYAVMLGPFTQKSAAEDTARSVGKTMGLFPQVLRLESP